MKIEKTPARRFGRVLSAVPWGIHSASLHEWRRQKLAVQRDVAIYLNLQVGAILTPLQYLGAWVLSAAVRHINGPGLADAINNRIRGRT